MSYPIQYYATDPNDYQEYATPYTYHSSPPGNYNLNGYEMAPNLSQGSGSSYESSNPSYPYPPQVSSPPFYGTASPHEEHPHRANYSPTAYYPTSPVSPTSYTHLQTVGQMDGPKNKSKQIYPCLIPECDSKANFKRLADLERHMKTVHFPERSDCPHGWCGRVGEHGFTRKDHLTDHLREVHMQDIPKATRNRRDRG